MITPQDRLDLINELISETGLDNLTPAEKLIDQIYMIAHPACSTCSHDDWEKETERLCKQKNY